MAQQFRIGRGTRIYVAKLPEGIRERITRQTLTVATGGATVGATSLPVTALTNAINASADSPVNVLFVNANGIETLVSIVATAAAGATSLTVAALPRAIAAASTADYPAKLLARTSAGLSTTANDVTTTTFDTDGYEDGIVSMIGYGLSAPGNFLPSDPGWVTCFEAYNNFQEVWLTLELPPPGGFTKGYVFDGAASVTNCPIDAPADGIITGNVDFKYRGKINITKPTI